ncbi:TPA: RICIN domain-containing protein, partial [Bacillus cytotoxicus]|nr:RICIN domain-containing protein [Bacillus cytotoxicus]
PFLQFRKKEEKEFTENQKFIFFKLDNNYYAIANKDNGTVIDGNFSSRVAPHFPKNSLSGIFLRDIAQNVVASEQWNGINAMQWYLGDTDKPEYKTIKSSVTGKAMDIANSSKTQSEVVVTNDSNGGASQKWRIVKREKLPMPAESKKEKLPDIPHYTSYAENLPEKTESVTTASTLIPYIMVNDTWSRKNQIDKTPYYKLVKKQYWKKQFDHVFLPGETQTEVEKYGISKQAVETMRDKLGIEATINAGLNFGADKASKKGSGSLSIKITKELETTTSNTTSENTEISKEMKYVNSSDQQVAMAKYALVTQYSLERTDGSLVSAPWEVIQENVTKSTTWPDKRHIQSSVTKMIN